MSADLDRLREEATVRLPGRSDVVTLVKVKSGPFWEFFFDGPDGPGKMVLAESELGNIDLIERPAELRFDGDPVQFRLGIEARRIETAFAYDMAAVVVSNVQPLPHQLEAVYDCFLREPRLRFLLADDPGAGETIMAGLYMKELILRRAGDRILVVTPANLRPQWVRELSDRFQLDFVQLGATHFDATITENPWDQFDRLVVSRDFLRTDRAREAFDPGPAISSSPERRAACSGGRSLPACSTLRWPEPDSTPTSPSTASSTSLRASWSEAGEHPRVIQHRLGHATARLSMDQRAAVEK